MYLTDTFLHINYFLVSIAYKKLLNTPQLTLVRSNNHRTINPYRNSRIIFFYQQNVATEARIVNSCTSRIFCCFSDAELTNVVNLLGVLSASVMFLL